LVVGRIDRHAMEAFSLCVLQQKLV
jgi:hypothetical protein